MTTLTLERPKAKDPNRAQNSLAWLHKAMFFIRCHRHPHEFLRVPDPGERLEASAFWEVKRGFDQYARLLTPSIGVKREPLSTGGFLEVPDDRLAVSFAGQCTSTGHSKILMEQVSDFVKEMDSKLLALLNQGIGCDRLLHLHAFGDSPLSMPDGVGHAYLAGPQNKLPKDHPARSWDSIQLYIQGGEPSIILGPATTNSMGQPFPKLDAPFVDFAKAKRLTAEFRLAQLRKRQQDSRGVTPDEHKRDFQALEKLENEGLPPRPRNISAAPALPVRTWKDSILDAVDCLKNPHHYLVNPPEEATFDHLLQVRTAMSQDNRPDDTVLALAISLDAVATSQNRKEELQELAAEILVRIDRELTTRIENSILWALTESENR